MKLKIILAVVAALTAALTMASSSAFADTSCSTQSGPGSAQIVIMPEGSFIPLNLTDHLTIFSCGKFVNDGSVQPDAHTEFKELAVPSCTPLQYGSDAYLLYCY